jgi:hypothetical protein
MTEEDILNNVFVKTIIIIGKLVIVFTFFLVGVISILLVASTILVALAV